MRQVDLLERGAGEAVEQRAVLLWYHLIPTQIDLPYVVVHLDEVAELQKASFIEIRLGQDKPPKERVLEQDLHQLVSVLGL